MSLAAKLEDALVEAGISKSELARRLAGSGAEERQVMSRRRAVIRWLKPGVGISTDNAEQLAAALGKPSGYFKEPRPAGTDLDRLRQRVVELLQEIDDVRKRLDGEVA